MALKDKVKLALKNLYNESKDYVDDVNKTDKLINDLESKPDIFDKINNVADDFPVLVDMIKDFMNKRYTDLPVKTIIVIIATIMYVVNPLDIIPDYIIGLGLVDDITAVSFCAKCIRNDIAKYKQWKNKENNIIDCPIQ